MNSWSFLGVFATLLEMVSISSQALPALLLLLVLLPAIQGAEPAKTTRDLTAQERKEVDRLRQQCYLHISAGDFEKAVQVFKMVVAYRAERQGAGQWEVIDAGLMMERLQRLTGVAAKDRAEVNRALTTRGEGRGLQNRLRYREAEAKLREALAIYKKILGEQHPETATSHHHLASCLSSQGKYAEALPLFQMALAIRQKALGEQHPDVALDFNHIAYCLVSQGKYAEALPLNQKALAIRRKALGEQHPDTASSYNSLASSLIYQGKPAEAQALLQKALAIRRKALGEQHPDTATSYNNLAFCLDNQGKHAEALPLHQKALAIWRKVVGEQHPNTAASYNNMALCLNYQAKHAEALTLFQNALAIRRKAGEQHPDTASSYNNVAACLDSQGKHAEAMPLHQKALAIRRKALGEQHPDTAISYNSMASCLNNQDRPAEALPLFQMALAIRQKALGEQHPDTASSYNNVAASLNTLGKPAEAMPFHQKALAIRRKALGEQHPDTASSYNNVAACLDSQGNHGEAQPLYQKALGIRRKALGEQHPDTATSYNNLAACLDSQGKHAEALPLLQKALAIWRRTLGELHPSTATSYSNVAFCLNDLGKHAEAAQHWQQAILGHDFGRLKASTSGFERSLFHAKYVTPRAALAAWLVRLGKPLAAWEFAETDLARGLLDDLQRSSSTGANTDRLTRLSKLDQALLPLLTRASLTVAETKQREDFARERDNLLADLARSAAKRARVLPFERIQKQIPPDVAVIFWLDIDVLDRHLGCILRGKGSPAWVKLPGSAKDDVWTAEDKSLSARILSALSDCTSNARLRQELIEQMHRQRIAPMKPHLKGVKHLLVVPAGRMAAVPVEALTDHYTVSYVPSASVFARGMEDHRPLEPSSLLVLADPVFTRTAPVQPAPPPHGLLVKAVLPGSLAARVGLLPGDVILEYDGKKLTAPADLKPAGDAERVPVKLWREGKGAVGRIPAGSLGVVVDPRPVAEALADWRRKEEVVRSASRGNTWPALPGTRLEARTLAGLVPKSTALLGSDASVQKLSELAAAGKLKDFRLLHLATHGEANATLPAETALILSQDKLPTRLDDEAAAVLAGKRVPDGKLTVGTILKEWQLDADLVVLSACQTGLGKQTSGEGMLGFTQALMQKGARSVVLSRWKVDDAATALLMARFYENLLGRRAGGVNPLLKPMKRAEALREAKSWLRGLGRKDAAERLATLVNGVPRGERSSIKAALPTRKKVDDPKATDRPFAHPYYWAAFVLLGDPE